MASNKQSIFVLMGNIIYHQVKQNVKSKKLVRNIILQGIKNQEEEEEGLMFIKLIDDFKENSGEIQLESETSFYAVYTWSAVWTQLYKI